MGKNFKKELNPESAQSGMRNTIIGESTISIFLKLLHDAANEIKKYILKMLRNGEIIVKMSHYITQ